METINGATYYPPVNHDAYDEHELDMYFIGDNYGINYGRNESMKITIKELMEKIDDIDRVMGELDHMPDVDACTKALTYLDEYVSMLKDIKVDI